MTKIDTSTPTIVEITPFTEAHLPGALALSQAAGWPHRPEDWALGLSVSQGVAAIADGRVVGTGLCSLHGPVATLNMIIVDQTLRGRGVGRQVMEHIIALAGGREMRLVATEDGRPLYRKLGFVECGRIAQLQGIARATRPEIQVSIGAADIAALAAMDKAASGFDRTPLLTRIAAMGDVLTARDGFALLRPFGRGHVLGPVVARDVTTARALIAAGAAQMQGRFLRIDVHEEHGLVPFVETLGLTQSGGGWAMVHTPASRPASEFQTHALVSQALG